MVPAQGPPRIVQKPALTLDAALAASPTISTATLPARAQQFWGCRSSLSCFTTEPMKLEVGLSSDINVPHIGVPKSDHQYESASPAKSDTGTP